MPNTPATRHRRDSLDLRDYARTQTRLARVCREAGRHDEASAIVAEAKVVAERYVAVGVWYAEVS